MIKAIRDGIKEYLLERLPSIAPIVANCDVVAMSSQYELLISDGTCNGRGLGGWSGFTGHSLTLSINTPAPYNFIHIECWPDIIIFDADEDYGPHLELEYSDPQLLEQIEHAVRKAAYARERYPLDANLLEDLKSIK